MVGASGREPHRWEVPLALAFIMLAFAGNSVITRYLIVGSLASPYLLTTVRFASGFGMLLLVRAIVPGASALRIGPRRDLLGGAFLGAYAFAISFGYLFIPAAAGTLVFYAFVVLTMAFFGYAHDRDRPTPRAAAGQVLAVVGVGIITFGGIRDVTLPGIALMAATGTSWGLYSVHGRGATNSQGYTFSTFLVVGAFSLGVTPILAFAAPGAVSIDIAWNGLGLALFMGMISTALSYILWNATLRRIPASQGGVVQLTVPVLASTMGILLLGEHLTAGLVLGAAAVLAGIYLNRVAPR
jgi:drug/metabolite transporter (DMT)-like permease